MAGNIWNNVTKQMKNIKCLVVFGHFKVEKLDIITLQQDR